MNSKNLYFTIFSLILLGFISSCAENSNKCSPSYASNIEQLNEKLYDSYANVAVRKNTNKAIKTALKIEVDFLIDTLFYIKTMQK